MKLYIDTQIYLANMSPTSDLKSLKKLKKLIKEGKIDILLPAKTKEEYGNHLEKRIGEEKDKLKKSIEQFLICEKIEKRQNKTKLEILRIKKIKSFNKNIKKSVIEETKDFKKHIKIVKKLIKEIFETTKVIRNNNETVLRAVIRYAKNLPPKKNDDKFGDAIIWETLKENVKEEITIISRDGDFDNKILISEWKKHSSKKLSIFKAIGLFLNTIDKKNIISQEVIEKEIKNTETINEYRLTAAPGIFTINPGVVNLRTNQSVFSVDNNPGIVSLGKNSIITGAEINPGVVNLGNNAGFITLTNSSLSSIEAPTYCTGCGSPLLPKSKQCYICGHPNN